MPMAEGTRDAVASVSAPAIAVDGGGAGDALRTLLQAALPQGLLLDTDGALARFRDQGVVPDAVVTAAPQTADAPMSVLVRHARAAGSMLPVIAVAQAGALPVCQPHIDTAVDPDCPPERLAWRIGETLRLSARLEEALLRRIAFGGGFAGPRHPCVSHAGATVLIHGDGQRLGLALAEHGSRVATQGAFSVAQVHEQLAQGGVCALLIDAPCARTIDLVAALRRDPRHVSLAILALATPGEEAQEIHRAGASDVLSRATPAAAIAARLSLLLRSGVRRSLSSARLERFREAVLVRDAELDATCYADYLKRLSRALAVRGRRPVVVRLKDVHAGPRHLALANDDAFERVPQSPVLSTALAASRDEDFIARVEQMGELAVLRDEEALAAFRRRVAGIVERTSFT